MISGFYNLPNMENFHVRKYYNGLKNKKIYYISFFQPTRGFALSGSNQYAL